MLDGGSLVSKSEQKPFRRITRNSICAVFLMPCRELTEQKCALLDCDLALRALSAKQISSQASRRLVRFSEQPRKIPPNLQAKKQ